MRKSLAFGLTGLLLLGSSGIGFAHLAPGAAYTIRYRPTVGRHLHYGMNMQMSGGGAPGGMAMTMGFTLTATAHSAGKYTVVTTIDSMGASGAPPAQADQMKKMLAGSKITQVVDEDGHIISTKAEGPMSGMMKGGMGSTGGIYPKIPVHVGDSWTGTSEAGGKSTSVRVKLVGVKTVGGKQVAVLNLVPMSATSGATSSPITVSIETATGVMRSMEMRAAMGAGAQSGGMHIVVNLRS